MSNAVLIVDGAYLMMNAKQQKNPIDLSNQGIANFVTVCEELIGQPFSNSYWFDAAGDVVSDTQRERLNRLKTNQFKVVQKGLKSQATKCPNKKCPYNKQPITRLVQAGVDVAIATKMLTLVCEGVLDVLFLVAGDGDFLEALKYIADTRHKKVYLAGFHGSVSQELQAYASRGCVYYLDDLWDRFCVASPPMTTDKDKRPPRMRTPDIERLTGSSDESVANSRAASPDDDMLGPTAAGEAGRVVGAATASKATKQKQSPPGRPNTPIAVAPSPRLANPPAGSDVGRSDKQLTIINSGLFIVDGQPLADLLGQGQSANEQLDKGNVCRSTTPKAPTSLVAQPRSFRLAKLAKLNQLPGESQPLRRQASNGRRAATPENSSRPQSPIAIPQPAPEPLLTNEEARADVAPRLGTANDTKLQAARRQASNDRRATTPENSSRPQSPITISQPAPEPLFLPIYEQARADKEPRFVGRASGTNSPSPDPPATAATAPSRTAIEAGMPISVMKQAARQAMKQSKQSNAPVPQSPPPAAPLELLSPDLLMAQADAKLQRLELLSPADLIGQMNIK